MGAMLIRGRSGWRILGFLATFVVLELSWEAARGTALERLVIHDATVRSATFLINALTPALAAQASESSIRAAGGGLNIRNGCEGLEVLFLLTAAFVVAPVPWRQRAAGLLLGTALIYVANEARIVGLFYAYRSDPALFDQLHSTVTPVAMILIVAFYFYAWLDRTRRSMAAA